MTTPDITRSAALPDRLVSDDQKPRPARPLDPISRISEVLFGLIMAVTFTGSLSAATARQEEVRTMLVGAIGCNIAWGLVDAVMYVMTRLTERGRDLSVVRSVRASADPAAARLAIADAVPPLLAVILSETGLEAIRKRLQELPEPPARPRLVKEDFLGAAAVFLLVAISTFPVVVPFLLMQRAGPALRVSNAVAVLMLFLCGYRLGQYSGHRPWWMGLSMAVIGTALVGLTIVLEG